MIVTQTLKLYVMFFLANLIIEKNVESSKGTFKYHFWKFLKYTYGPIFITSDVIYDITIGSIVFKQLPRWFTSDLDEARRIDKTFTGRLKFIKNNDFGWRFNLAVKYCKLINKIDSDHC